MGNEEVVRSTLVRIDKAAPAAVSDLVASAASVTSIALTWSNPVDRGAGNASFDVRYRAGNAFSEADWATASQITGEPVPPATGMTVQGLTCGTTYTFALKTTDTVGNESAPSNPVTQATLVCVDTTPPSLTIISHTNGQIVSTSTITVAGTATDARRGGNGISSVVVPPLP